MRIQATSTTIGRSGPEQKLYRYGGDKPYVPTATERQKNPGAAANRAAEKAERLRRFTEHRDKGVPMLEAGALAGVKLRAARRYEAFWLAIPCDHPAGAPCPRCEARQARAAKNRGAS